MGMKVGETRDIQLVLPDDFEPAGLRGVDVTCTVRVTELFQYELAEVLLDSASMTSTVLCCSMIGMGLLRFGVCQALVMLLLLGGNIATPNI